MTLAYPPNRQTPPWPDSGIQIKRDLVKTPATALVLTTDSRWLAIRTTDCVASPCISRLALLTSHLGLEMQPGCPGRDETPFTHLHPAFDRPSLCAPVFEARRRTGASPSAPPTVAILGGLGTACSPTARRRGGSRRRVRFGGQPNSRGVLHAERLPRPAGPGYQLFQLLHRTGKTAC